MSASGQVANPAKEINPAEEINPAKEIFFATQADSFAEIGVGEI
ncbi:MAG TPA: hypothetical protein VLA42_03215 [Verrucomicrobiae bacterium]|jgi:hypothetical protein|nr:hypothetical protein [Verrucomicrobiae bacterium]